MSNSISLSLNDVHAVNVRNTQSGYKMTINLNGGRTVTRSIEAKEAREYFALNADAQKQFVVELFNAKYQASQFTAAQYVARRPMLTAEEERFISLRAQRKINALPTEEEQEYQALKSKLENA
jgi:hypothetical protein